MAVATISTRPQYHSQFRKDNQKAIREVFRHTPCIAKQFQLIGGKLIAGDSDQTSGSKQQEKQF
ncbi:MAG: hypothetical protein IPG29_09585 [Sphingobacteriales bacterium]|nr:hypothetical protein [Sphingobacteriales bacterium]